MKEAARIAAEGVDEDYFQRIRKASFGANLRGLNSFENIAVTLTEGYFHGYDPLFRRCLTPSPGGRGIVPEGQRHAGADGGQPHCAENLTLWERRKAASLARKHMQPGRFPC